MYKLFLTALFLQFFTGHIFGQEAMMTTMDIDSTLHREIALHIGGSNYQGDLVESDIWYFPETKVAVGVSFTQDMNNNFKVGAKLSYGSIAGSDQNFDSRKSIADNLNFTATYVYFGINGEWYPFGREKRIKYFNAKAQELRYMDARYQNMDIFDDKQAPIIRTKNTFTRRLLPYLSGGAVVLFNNPKVGSNGATATPWETLLVSNGVITKTVLGLSGGVGLKYYISEVWTIGVEYQSIYCFSDYIDGWSKVRDADDLDWVTQANLVVGYRF